MSNNDMPKYPFGYPHPYKFNLLELGLVGLDQIDALLEVNEKQSQIVVLDGEQPESTLERPDDPLSYGVVDGEVIGAELPWLEELYRSAIPKLAKNELGIELVPSRFRRSGITLNTILGKGNRYELHVDENPVTGLLFATTNTPQDGGALALYHPTELGILITPIAGDLLLFDGRWSPHEVLPLRSENRRVSVPMNYFRPGDVEERARHIDEYIF